MIGAGPAGLTAATYLARFRRAVLVADGGEPRANWIPVSHNTPGFPEGLTGRDMLARMRAQAEEYGAIVVVGIKMVAQQLRRRTRDQEADFRADRAGEGALQQVGDESGGALGGLERDIAGEAVAHDHVMVAAREPVALDEAGELHLAQLHHGVEARDDGHRPLVEVSEWLTASGVGRTFYLRDNLARRVATTLNGHLGDPGKIIERHHVPDDEDVRFAGK